ISTTGRCSVCSSISHVTPVKLTLKFLAISQTVLPAPVPRVLFAIFAISIASSVEIAKIANRTRGAGAGRTVWDMAKNFNVSLTGVTWEMLEQTEHRPVVLIRVKETKIQNVQK
ncbi:MAG: hypothetical protein P8X87_03970, partial [Candidatus Bathyarchaeota archaeon]